MKSLTSRQKILFCVYAMILAMIGDYLLGFGTLSFSDSPDAYMGMTANVVPDWRYASSSVLGFICAALFAVAATELMKVMEKKYGLAESKLYKLFKIANWGGILYFAFIHIGICMLPVVFNAGMEATGSLQASIIKERTDMKTVIWGLLIPLIGTAAGAACVFFLKNDLKANMQRALTGFAAGVMVAASIWSLIVPAIEQSADKGRWAFLPAFIGFWLGILFLLLLDHVIPHLHRSIDQADQVEGTKAKLNRTLMLILAVTLHNIPEGMAVGVVYAGLLSGSANITAGGALALALGIAIQNFPEGAIISMPLFAEGKSKPKSFLLGVLSGAVEPVFGGLTVLVASLVVPAMPYLLSFAAGAMLYVVVEELIPEMSSGEHSNIGVVFFAVGFSLMMALDVALG